MDNTIITLIGIHRDHTSVVNTLWTIFQGVSLALLGYIFTQEFVRKNTGILLGLTVAFLVFAIGNQTAVCRSQALVHAAATELKAQGEAQKADFMGKVLQAYESKPTHELRIGHTIFTLLVLATIWMLHFFVRSGKTESVSPAENLLNLQIRIAELQLKSLEKAAAKAE